MDPIVKTIFGREQVKVGRVSILMLYTGEESALAYFITRFLKRPHEEQIRRVITQYLEGVAQTDPVKVTHLGLKTGTFQEGDAKAENN